MKKQIICSLLGITTYALSSTPVLNTFYELNETDGIIANDSMDIATPGNLVNSPSWTQDGNLSFLDFDGSLQQYIDCGTSAALSGKTDFTVSAWIKTTSSGVIIQQRCKGSATTNGWNGEYIFEVDNNGFPRFTIYGGGYQFYFSGNILVTDDEWHLVTATRLGEQGSIFVDGVLAGSASGTCRPLDASISVIIGADERANKKFFTGSIDDVKIFTTALTESEVAFLAENRGLRLSGDADGDSLTNAEEANFGSNPFDGNSDGDAYSDAEEIANGTDPNVHNGDGAPAGWMFASIGNTTEDSTISYDGEHDSFSLQVKSGDIWNKVDNFGYAYKTIRGDFSATVKVDSVTGKSAWTKASLMVRNVAESRSAFASAIVSKGNGLALQGRENENNWCFHQGATGIKAPYWLRLIRKANLVTAYVSHDGKYWAELGTKTVNLEDEVKIGLGLCTNNLDNFANATFSEFELQALDDLDADGLSDLEERMLLTDLTSDDTDIDQNSDLNELTAENSPLVPPTEIDGKIYHKSGLIAKFYFGLFKDLPDFSSLPINEVLIRKTASFDLGWDEITELTGQNITAMTLESMLYVPEDGEYTFYTNSDDGSRLLIDGNSLVENGGAHGMRKRSATVTLTAGLHKFELQYFQQGGAAGLWTSWSGPAFEEQIIPRGNFVYSTEDFTAAFELKDQDSDGLTDIFEDEIGSDKTKADSNGDGLTDKEKYDLGLDLMKIDSDADGISDYREIHEYLSDPTQSEFDGTEEIIASASGNTGVAIKGEWRQSGTSLYAVGRNGAVGYTFSIPEDGVFSLRIQGSQNNSLSEQTEFTIDVYTDTSYTGRNLLRTASLGYTDCVLPYLQAGEHSVKLDWRNVESNTSLKIDSVSIIKLNGSDSDNDGILDWQQYRLDNFIGFKEDTVTESFVSPFCIEGKAIYLEHLSLTGSYTPANGDYLVNDDGTINIPSYKGISTLMEESWFANAPLSPVDATILTATFQNGLKESTHTVTWKAINLLKEEEDVEEPVISSITIRTGDSLLLTAQNECKSRAAITISIDQETYSLNYIPGNAVGQSKEEIVNDYVTKIADHLSYTFNDEGMYSVTATFDPEGNGNGKELINGRTFIVNVISSSFSSEPVCFVNTPRTWDNPTLGHSSALEFSYGLSIQDYDLEPKGKILNVTSSSTDNKRVISRLYDNGPILATQNIKTLNRYYGASNGELTIIQTFPDGSDMIQFNLVLDDIPDDLLIKVHIFVGGITFDDGTVTKEFTAADFNEYGELRYTLIRSRYATSGNCHWIKYFQGDSQIF